MVIQNSLESINKDNVKKSFLLFGMEYFTFFVFSCHKLRTEAYTRGMWKGSCFDQELTMMFHVGKRVVLTYLDKQSNQPQKENGNFELYFSKKPIPLSIQNIPQLNYQPHTIIEFIGKDSIQLSRFSTRWRLRPISFESGRTINQKRTHLLN